MPWIECAKRPGDLRDERGQAVAHRGQILWLSTESCSYDPVKDRWDKLEVPFDYPRSGSVLVSTGDELIVWSGARQPYRYSRSSRSVADGQRLLADRTWRPMSNVKAPGGRSGASAAWTGDKLVIWGGANAGSPRKTGGVYDPATDTWTKISTKNAASAHNACVWSGQELWLWDSWRGTGAAYAPATDLWRPLAKLPGTDEQLSNGRDLIRLGDGALTVGRDDEIGSDLDTCSAWRYEPRADLWEPCAPPPETRGSPQLIDCGGRIVLVNGGQLFEYLTMSDTWVQLPNAPDHAMRQQLMVLGGTLFIARPRAMYRLELPAAGTRLAPVAATVPITRAAVRPAVVAGPAVTAIATLDRQLVIGYLDGAVRCGETELRKPNGERVLGLAIHDGMCTCLVGNALELRSWPRGGNPTVIELPFDATMMAHHDSRLIVAGNGALAMLVWQRDHWKLVKRVATKGTTTHVAVNGELVTRVQLAEWKPPRDLVELRNAELDLLASFKPDAERGGTAAVPFEGDALVAGAGTHDLTRHRAGKKRPIARIPTETAWSSPLVSSSDGRTIVVRTAGSGIELYDLTAGIQLELVLGFELGDVEAAYPPVPYLTAAASAKLVETARIRGSISAISIDPLGSTIAIGTPLGASFLIDRASLAITLFDATGKSAAWQPGLVTRVEWWGDIERAVADVESASVFVVRSDGQIGKLDVDSGTWRWGLAGEVPEEHPPSLDGHHEATPEGRSGPWRRWKITDGTATRSFEFEDRFEALGVIPGGTIVGWTNEALSFLDSDDKLVTIAGHRNIQGACASRDGSHLVTWNSSGTFRRWKLG